MHIDRTGSRGKICVAGVLICVVASGSLFAQQQCDPIEVARLASATGQADGFFGFSVAIEGDTAVVGMPDDGAIAPHAGAVYVYRFDGKQWNEQAVLSASDATDGDFFGSSVSVSDGVLLIGAFGDDDQGSRSGSAYVFGFDGIGWVEQAKLLPSDGGPTDFFGGSVSLSGTVGVISAERDDDNGSNAGAVYVFRFDGSQWVEQTKLIASDGEGFDAFGIALEMFDDTVVIGASGDSDHGNASGSAYVFRFDGAQWVEEAKIVADDGSGADFFGESVAIDGDTVVIGSHWDDDNGSNSGSAYVFARIDGVWTQQAKLLASDGAASEQFGWSVAIWEDMAVVGANEASFAFSEAGAAYVFSRNAASEWVEVAQLRASNAGGEDDFANAVAVWDGNVIVGAFAHDGEGLDSGAGYIFTLDCPCPADFTGDGSLDIFDLLAFLDAFNNGNASADFTGDGFFDIFDLLAFLDAFNAGCV